MKLGISLYTFLYIPRSICFLTLNNKSKLKVFSLNLPKNTMGLHVGISPKPFVNTCLHSFEKNQKGLSPSMSPEPPCLQMDHAYSYISFINSIIYTHFVIYNCSYNYSYLFMYLCIFVRTCSYLCLCYICLFNLVQH